MSEKNYAKGIFVKQPHEAILSVGVKKEQFIEWLQQLETNDKGYCNLTFGKRKEVGKYGDTHWVAEDRYQFGNNENNKPCSLPEDENDSLPF